MAKITKEILDRMRIPEVHRDAVLSKIPTSCPHRAVMSEYVENLSENVRRPKGLLLFGDYSRGKSALAAIILKAAVAKLDLIGFWMSARDITRHIMDKTVFDSEMSVYERAETVPILVLDELIIRDDIKYTEQSLEFLIRHRVAEKLCTIVTMNYRPEELDKKYPSLVAVMREALVGIRVAGHDFRKDIASTL